MASFPWVFPYGEDLVSRTSAVTDRVILRPFVTVAMVGQEEQSVLALVDSGSEHTLSGMGFARLTGVEPDPNTETVLGVGGAWRTARFADVTLRLGPRDAPPKEHLEWQAPVGFFTQWEPPWGLLLGQVGFFDRFTVTMSRLSQALALEAGEDFDRRFGVYIERE
jgi:hypothetical protein